MRALLHIEVKGGHETFADSFFKVASGFTMVASPANIDEAAVIYFDVEGPQLGKALAVLPSWRGKDREKIIRLLHAIRYLAHVQLVSPMAGIGIWTVLEKELRDVTEPRYASQAHDVIKKIYPSVLKETLDPVLETAPVKVSVENKIEAFYAASALAATCSGVHRLGLAFRQIVAQALAFELLGPANRGALDGEVARKLLAAIAADAYVWYPFTCARKAAGTLRGELYSAIVGLAGISPLARFFTGEEQARDISIPKGACCLAAYLSSLLRDGVEGQNLLKRTENLKNKMVDSIFIVYPDKLREELRTDPLIGLILRVLRSLGKLEEGKPGKREEPAEVGLLMLATEQFGPGLLNFVTAFLEEQKRLSIAERVVLYTPATLMNVLITREYLKAVGREREVRFLPVGATNPELTYRIALSVINELLERCQELLVLVMGHMAPVLSVAKACVKCDKPDSVRLVIV